MIVGFPGETEEDFSESLELIERVRPNKVNITRYSQRPFTPLSSEKDFPDWVKKDRSRSMNTRAEKIYASVNRGYLEQQVPFRRNRITKKGICNGPISRLSGNCDQMRISQLDIPVR